jgi:hypothetical protein
MYHFYLIESLGGRAGFGIAQDIKERNKQYCSHAGGIVKMQVYSGLRAHAKALERTIKTQYIDNLWIIEDWKTEWLNDSIPMGDLKDYVDSLISERHFRIKLVAQDYDFTKGNIEEGVSNGSD